MSLTEQDICKHLKVPILQFLAHFQMRHEEKVTLMKISTDQHDTRDSFKDWEKVENLTILCVLTIYSYDRWSDFGVFF